ncbi:Uncharacterised protein [Chlamydia trachomatis]|nr:Uncharacterised protein [Chlamydia trachomatis]
MDEIIIGAIPFFSFSIELKIIPLNRISSIIGPNTATVSIAIKGFPETISCDDFSKNFNASEN